MGVTWYKITKGESLSIALRWGYILLGPALLLLTAYLLGGARFDTNDDATLELLLQGVAAARPLSDLHLYFLGWARLTAALYTWMPAFPWYDLLQVVWLYIALATIFYLLAAVLPLGRWGWHLLLVSSIVFAASYLLHLLQVNFTRPALLLGAVAAGLLALPTAGRPATAIRWLVAGLLFTAGWGIRPIAAELGLLLMAPVVLVRSVRQWSAALLYMLALSGTLVLATRLGTTPAEEQYTQLNAIRADAFDYQHYTFDLRTPTDSLAYATFRLGSGPYDAKLINDSFLRRCLRPAAIAITTTVLHEWASAAIVMLHQWQPLALVLLLCQWVAVGWASWRGRLNGRYYRLWLFAAYQVFFGTLYLGVGIYFHPVARVAQPMITSFLVGNFLLLGSLGKLTLAEVPLRPGWLVVSSLALIFTARHAQHLVQEGRLREQAHANYLAQLARQAAGTILVEGGLYNEFDNLNLFKSYNLLGYKRILSLGGWSTYDPSRPALYRYLTGQNDVATALLVLGRRTDVTWVLDSELADVLKKYLNARSRRSTATTIILEPAAGRPLGGGPLLYTFKEVPASITTGPPSMKR